MVIDKTRDFSTAMAHHTCDGLASMIRRLEGLLEHDRLLHSLGTFHTMLLLADGKGKERCRAAVTGLVHDLARGFSKPEIKRRLEAAGVAIAEEDLEFPKIWHARLGAMMLQTVFGIDDPEMTRAVRIHPTGAAEMSDLARRLFVADYIEPTRNFEGVEDLRKLAFRDKDAAFKAVLKRKTDHVRRKGKPLHNDSIEALKNYLQEE